MGIHHLHITHNTPCLSPPTLKNFVNAFFTRCFQQNIFRTFMGSIYTESIFGSLFFFLNNLYAKISSKLHLIHRWNISFKPLDWSLDELFSEVSAQVLQQPNTTLDRNNNLKRKRQCKIWRFSWPRLGSLEPLLKITRGTKKTTSSLDRSGRQLSCEPIQVVRVSCKPFSNKWPLSCLDVSRGLFSLVQSALALF